jgi:hypothetical protein
MKQLIIILLFINPLWCLASLPKSYPSKIEIVLKKAGKNKSELEKAIRYFQKTNDLQKLRAIYFLIENMDIHSSADYQWEDEHGKKVEFNELNYKDFNSAKVALEQLKKAVNIHTRAIVKSDVQFIKSDFLIDNVESAFKAWRCSSFKNIDFKYFCEYILPYRISEEPLQTWRLQYGKKFSWLNNTIKQKGYSDALYSLTDNYKNSFVSTFLVEERVEPLPRLGALQLLFRKRGACEDVADLEVFTLRSQGLPASVDFIPYWATSFGGHFLNSTFDLNMKPISFDVYRTGLNEPLPREPAKVLRLTYSNQPSVLANKVADTAIPKGFLKLKNYIDVTASYWKTDNIVSSLFTSPIAHSIAYLSTFNYSKWRPVWWGNIKNGQVIFRNMPKGAVFLPSFYTDNKMVPAGYPIAVGYHHTLTLKPDLKHLKPIVLKQRANYLQLKVGKTYALYYWDNNWKNIGRQAAKINTESLAFTNVPDNALLILIENGSSHKERPFIITQEGSQVWF